MAILNLYSGCCVICLQQDRLLFPRQRAAAQRSQRVKLLLRLYSKTHK